MKIIIETDTIKRLVKKHIVNDIKIAPHLVGDIEPKLEWYGYGNECEFTGITVELQEAWDEEN